MLSSLEIGAFRAFGYVVVRNCLSPPEMVHLDKAYARVIATADPYDYFGQGGTRMTLHVEESDDTFAELIGHPRIDEAVRNIWGSSAIFLNSDMWWNMDDTPWHSDGSPGRQPPSFKLTFYLDPTTADDGALRIVPGSHHPAFCSSILSECGYWDRRRPRLQLPSDQVPGAVAVETQPGDVVIWDNRMWHSAPKRRDGRPRRALFFSYAPDPGEGLSAIDDVRTTIESVSDRPFLYGRRLLRAGGPVVAAMASRVSNLMGRDVCEPAPVEGSVAR
jgi:hypothetical protein